MPLLVRRVVESIVISILASVPMTVLQNPAIGIIPTPKGNGFSWEMLLVYGIDTLVFFILSWFVLRIHLLVLDNWFVYLRVNLLIYFIHLLICLFGVFFMKDLYTMLFGYTKLLRAFGLPQLASTIVTFVLYLAEILFFPIARYRALKHMPPPPMIPEEYRPQYMTELPPDWDKPAERKENQ